MASICDFIGKKESSAGLLWILPTFLEQLFTDYFQATAFVLIPWLILSLFLSAAYLELLLSESSRCNLQKNTFPNYQ